MGHSSTVDSCTMWGLDAVTPVHSEIHIELYSQPSLSGGSNDNESGCSAVDLGPIPGLGRSPGEGNSYLPQYYGLENSTDQGAWKATLYGVAKS